MLARVNRATASAVGAALTATARHCSAIATSVASTVGGHFAAGGSPSVRKRFCLETPLVE